METLNLLNKKGRAFVNEVWQNVNDTAKKKDFQFHSKLSLEGKLRTVKLLKSWCFEGLRVLRTSVTGMMKHFFESEISDSEIFLGRKIWQVFFGVD